MYRPTDLRRFLTSMGIQPKKGLSQNFLIDGNIIRKIVTTADIHANDIVLEIGPGPGALTEALLDANATVIAVEKDKMLAQALERLQKDNRKLAIYCDDIMDFPLEKELLPHIDKGKKIKVVANLPYHLTTPILTMLIPRYDLISSLTVMMQEEVAKRITAQPGNKDYGSISIFLQYYSSPHYAFTISHHCFYPQPKIDSAVVTFTLEQPPKDIDENSLFQITRTAFEQRRKMLKNSLKDLYSHDAISNALQKIGCNPQARPEELSLEQYILLYKQLC